MGVIDLDELDIEQLEEVIERAQGLLKKLRSERKTRAIEEARAILEKAGVSPRELARTKPAQQKPPAVKAGAKYVNPQNSAESWVAGRGRRPNWVKALEAEGKLPKPQ